jgi:hypothetical protein
MQLFSYVGYRQVALRLVGLSLLSACGGSSTPASTDSSVDAAYAALVADAANCGKQVKSCVDAAGTDATALDACRTQFDSCRESVGNHVANSLAGAVTACTSSHNECVRQGHGAAADGCHDDLEMCLRAAHPDTGRDDEDGGVDEAGGKPEDCLDELHRCVDASGSAKTCADEVRSCVVDSMPTADQVVPKDDSDDGDQADDEGMSGEAGHGMSGAAGKSGSSHAPDAGAKGSAAKSAAEQCVEALSTCIDGGSAPRTCAQNLKTCMKAAKP